MSQHQATSREQHRAAGAQPESRMVDWLGQELSQVQVRDTVTSFLKPDLTVAIDASKTTFNSLTFTVSLLPGVMFMGGEIGIWKPTLQKATIRITDHLTTPVIPGSDITLDLVVSLSLYGDAKTFTMTWPARPDWHAHYKNQITVVVDPDHLIAERNEANNAATWPADCTST